MMILKGMLSIILGSVFLTSALPKLRYPKGFLFTVLEYRILPPSLGKLYARLVPFLELLMAIFLLGGFAIRFAAMVIALLLLSFIIAVSINLVRGRTLDCHCFGQGIQRSIGWRLLLQDNLLMSAAIILCTITPTWVALEPWSIFSVFGTNAAILPILLICLGVTVGVTTLVWNRRDKARRMKRRAT